MYQSIPEYMAHCKKLALDYIQTEEDVRSWEPTEKTMEKVKRRYPIISHGITMIKSEYYLGPSVLYETQRIKITHKRKTY